MQSLTKQKQIAQGHLKVMPYSGVITVDKSCKPFLWVIRNTCVTIWQFSKIRLEIKLIVSAVPNHWNYFPKEVKTLLFNPKEGHPHSLKISPKNWKIGKRVNFDSVRRLTKSLTPRLAHGGDKRY